MCVCVCVCVCVCMCVCVQEYECRGMLKKRKGTLFTKTVQILVFLLNMSSYNYSPSAAV